MAQNRKKQREHRKCGMTKDERLKMEAAQRDAEQAAKEKARREELLDRVDFCGIRQPTPYEAVKNIVRDQRRPETRAKKTTTGSATTVAAAV